MECVTSPSYSIMINGSPHGFFPGKRGLRQGDPMSPSLFILCIEYFSRLLALHTHGGGFNFHPGCARLGITHLAFADDLMLFGRGDNYSMQVLADAIEEFSACSGLEVNQAKSNLFFAGTMAEDTKAHITHMFGYTSAKLSVKYLGIPLASKLLKTADYSDLIQKMTSTVKKWNGKSLSCAGRLELIKSCLQGIEAYWLQAFPVPDNVASRIVAVARNFLWASKHAKVAWSTICLPKQEGGLGVRDIGTWNTTLHTKILWNVHTKTDSLWIKWIHTEILKDADFWE
ncbi:uncharacterized protein LOC125220400 [Salvia hispanica]|uniref:uncharacterized protein LOC125220400 n=1 Tax=Salvia hispanica TaxID=49212 RepID=UPI0020095F87|nr:uncharacterized protein LOC125220400 [Salvia hispanica]